MENLININNTKENTLEFEMVIEGGSTTEVDCNFVIVTKDMELRFPAALSEGKQGHWSVNLPAMNFLERTAYKCYTEVVTEGQYFKPMSGNLNVVGSAEIFTSTPKNTTMESDIKKRKVIKEKEEKRKVSRQKPWRQSEKPISQLAEEIINKEKYGKEKITEKVEEKKTAASKVDTGKDAKVRAILENVAPVNSEVITKEVRKVLDESKITKKRKAVPAKQVKEAVKKPEVEKPEEKKVEPPVVETQDDKVRAILESSGIKPKKKKRKKVSFVRTKPLDS